VDALVAARDHHFHPELGLDPHRPGSLLLFEADLPNHLETALGFDRAKVDALLCHRSQLESTMGISGAPTDADRSTFAAKVRHQLAAHGALAGRPHSEAFRLIDDL